MAISLDEQLRILRVAVEADIGSPSQILVASADQDDGAPALALGLARAFAAAGRSTALLHLDATEQRAASALGLRLADLKAKYDVCIVEAAQVLESSVALEAARIVDGVILVVGLGRRVRRADRDVVPALTRFGARVLGVVAAEPRRLAEIAAAGAYDVNIVAPARSGLRVVLGETESPTSVEPLLVLER
jgi:Mrp family chromosome partitioning ATPase